ncbi:hypothetical protein RclHR1_02670005 [Rhizophagus clarus]|uniref:Uncharacterized protein n=1 Tax=Rhizophagus clarus TaxID=94130 RepID=A0A2Z6RVH3_9GLOM|nr:hypothetical protein RclHR1_02670005 [Rhizophagus clarus]GES82573.1 hypothetical protein RCL_jg25388.t1 [Rhizophagus clarus]
MKFSSDKIFVRLEYADDGALNDYLSKHFNELDWWRVLSVYTRLYDERLILDMLYGKREKIIDGTSVENGLAVPSVPLDPGPVFGIFGKVVVTTP